MGCSGNTSSTNSAALGHASGATTGAEPTALAAEGHQVLMVTLGALYPQESAHQTTAFEVIGKFLLHMQRLGLAVHGDHIPEFRLMPLDNLIEKRLFRSMTFVRQAAWRTVRDRGLRHWATTSRNCALRAPSSSSCTEFPRSGIWIFPPAPPPEPPAGVRPNRWGDK